MPGLIMYCIGAAITLTVLVIGMRTEAFIAAGYNPAAFELPSVMATLMYIYFSSDAKKVGNLIEFQFCSA